MNYFIDVILPIPLRKEFTYSVTRDEAIFLRPGMRVAVPFGKTKMYAGVVSQIHQAEPQLYEAKEINHILDEEPVVTEKQLQLWKWMTSYYMAAVGEVLRTALPSAFLLESETIILKNENVDETIVQELKDDEFLVYEALQYQSLLKVQEIMSIINKKNVLPTIKRLIEKSVITVHEEIYEQYKPKLVKHVRLHPKYEGKDALSELLEQVSRAPKQKAVMLKFYELKARQKKGIKINDLAKAAEVSNAIIKQLIKKEILEEYQIQTDRIQFEGAVKDQIHQLNPHQEKAFTQIKYVFNEKDVCLLHGVTSSGKTEVYIKLIQEAIEEGKQVLYLLPEIALTTQLIWRLQKHFGDKLGVYHSKYSVHERVELWNNVLKKNPKAQIVIGARSAIFLPFQNLGLIVVDEEHETTFKQFDPTPRYHARDTAIVLARLFDAKIILGSATPAIETYYNAQQGKYGLVTLTKRHGNVLMPDMSLVDIKEKYRKKRMKGHFSDTLLESMHEALNEGEQVILFQNRRGYSPVVECVTCGHSPQCPNCDVSLTYHQYRNQLRCHYCGYNIAMMQNCHSCTSTAITTKGFGTEQIEKELIELFPKHKIGRMDQDSTKGKYGHAKIITALENGEIDILVGTQMLTKGLDFKNVSLVGVLNADNMLNFPDFRSHERSFQLIQQVAGRAGRDKKRGKVLIQTYNPHHQILQQVSINDYGSMYKEQLEERKLYKYPPFFRLIKITCKHKDYNKVNEASMWIAQELRKFFKQHILGPEFPPVARIRNQYHKHILVKIPNGQSLIQTKQAIHKVLNRVALQKQYASVRILLNVDNQ